MRGCLALTCFAVVAGFGTVNTGKKSKVGKGSVDLELGTESLNDGWMIYAGQVKYDGSVCADTDNGHRDKEGDGCLAYEGSGGSWCPGSSSKYSTESFDPEKACCICGGGYMLSLQDTNRLNEQIDGLNEQIDGLNEQIDRLTVDLDDRDLYIDEMLCHYEWDEFSCHADGTPRTHWSDGTPRSSHG